MTVDTVRGRIPAGALGVTLMHEHVFVLSPEIMANYPEGWGDEQAREQAAVEKLNALKAVFTGDKRPKVSSTKALTGHGLSLAGALEAGICCLALREGFMPASAKIQNLDPACEGISILTQRCDEAPRVTMSNSSGFGGANVALIFGQA